MDASWSLLEYLETFELTLVLECLETFELTLVLECLETLAQLRTFWTCPSSFVISSTMTGREFRIRGELGRPSWFLA